jgi:hypothetical protein
MSRRASLAFGIFVTWSIAVVGAWVIGICAAFPLGLFVGGDVYAARLIGFVLGMLALGAWALRTTASLVRDEQAADDVFRAPWPSAGRGAELRALGLLDRRGQPGPAARASGDHDAELRGGQRAQKGIVLDRTIELRFLVTGTDALARILDVEQEERVRAIDDGRPRRVTLEPGTYFSVIERTDTGDPRRAQVHAWWIGTDAT